MKTSLKVRALALLGSILVTSAMVQLTAGYALPEQPATRLAQAASRG